MDTFWALGLLLPLLPFLLWLLFNFNDWKYSLPSSTHDDNGGKLPPGHMGFPLIGELLTFLWHFKLMRTPDDFIRNKIAKYGNTGVFRTHLFGSPSIITCSPEMNKFVMGSSADEYGNFTTGWPAPRVFGEQFIGMVDGERHKYLRRFLLEAINKPQSLQNIFIRLQPVFKDSFETWAVKGKFSAHDEIRSLAFSNMCSLLVSFQEKGMLDKMERMYRGLMAGGRASPINIPGTALHYALQCKKKIWEIISCEVKDRKSTMGYMKQDLLQELMDSVDINGNHLSEDEIIDNISSLILAGYESTSLSMTWAMYYLFKYPQVLFKLKEEITTIHMHKGDSNKFLDYDEVKKMTYATKVINEILRLANISSFMFRTVAKDTEFNGYKFPRGWKVILWLRTIHVDSQYFKDPLEFCPERWEDFRPKLGVNNVFGLGPRQCPGNNLAKMQLIIFLYYMCIDYRWEFIDPNESIKFLPHQMPENGAQIMFSHA